MTITAEPTTAPAALTEVVQVPDAAALHRELCRLPPLPQWGGAYIGTIPPHRPAARYVTLDRSGLWGSDGAAVLRLAAGAAEGRLPLDRIERVTVQELLEGVTGPVTLSVRREALPDCHERTVTTLSGENGVLEREDVGPAPWSLDVAAWSEDVGTRLLGTVRGKALLQALQAACRWEGPGAGRSVPADLSVVGGELVLEGTHGHVGRVAVPAQGAGDDTEVSLDMRRLWSWAKRLPKSGDWEVRYGHKGSVALLLLQAPGGSVYQAEWRA